MKLESFYHRATLWLDDNSDWLFLITLAIVILLATAIITTYLPLPLVWRR